jgi:hypothetical protein
MNDLDSAVESEEAIAWWIVHLKNEDAPGAITRVCAVRPSVISYMRSHWYGYLARMHLLGINTAPIYRRANAKEA